MNSLKLVDFLRKDSKSTYRVRLKKYQIKPNYHLTEKQRILLNDKKKLEMNLINRLYTGSNNTMMSNNKNNTKSNEDYENKR